MKYYINFYPNGLEGDREDPEVYAYRISLPPTSPHGIHIELDIPDVKPTVRIVSDER